MQIDLAVDNFMGSIENPVLVKFFEIVALITEPELLFVFSLLIGAYFYFSHSKKKGGRKKGLVFLGTALFATILIKVLKEIVQRARPLNSLIAESSYSFPSGHATFAVVFFGLIAYFFMTKKSRVKWVVASSIMAFVVAFSRLYLRVHWITDVLAGLVLGAIILVLGIFVYEKIK